MIGPFARVPVASLRAAVRLAALATVILMGAIQALGAPLLTTEAPLGIVSLQFAPTVASAEAILGSWSEVPRARLSAAHGLDILLPVAYASLLVLAAARIAERDPADAARRRRARRAALAGLGAAAADQVENVAMAITILGRPSPLTIVATVVAAGVKWILLLAAVFTLVAARLPLRGITTDRAA